MSLYVTITVMVSIQNSKKLVDTVKKQKDEIKKLKKIRKYGIVWEENESVQNATICKPVFKNIQTKNIKHDDSRHTNMLIEGDNYHALSVLSRTYNEKIDVIYIDPPYNRNGDFMYTDMISNKSDSYKHSAWLTFMKSRLMLARQLLTDDGIIFISIDHKEMATLKLLCDTHVFGENNFLACVTWRSLHTIKNNARHFSQSTEFILVYAKDKTKIGKLRQPSDKTAQYPFDANDGKGAYGLGELSARNKNTKYEFYFDKWNVTWTPSVGSYPRYSKSTLKKMYMNDEIVYRKNWKAPQAKRYLSRVQEGIPPSTFWDGLDVGFNKNGTSELAEILTRDAFTSPKPVSLVKRCLEIGFYGKKNGVVLDFMAGSGTTGHALLEMNADDGGSRTFILCTNNENHICSDVCYPRLKKVMRGYKFSGKNRKKLLEKKLSYTSISTGKIYQEIEDMKRNNMNEYDAFEVSIKNETIRLLGVTDINGRKNGLGGNLKYFKIT